MTHSNLQQLAQADQGEMFDLPLQVIWPTNPDEVKVLQLLLSGERLTQPKYGFDDWRLGARIKSLKYKNFPIESLRIPHRRSAPPYACNKIAEYHIKPEDIFILREMYAAANTRNGGHYA